jgi:hypothetical protein
MVGMDTRPSSPQFLSLLRLGCNLFNCTLLEHGLCTTPQLHWLVNRYNHVLKSMHSPKVPKTLSFNAGSGSAALKDPASLQAYYETLAQAFATLMGSVLTSCM